MFRGLGARVPTRYRPVISLAFWVVVGILAAALITTYSLRSYRVDGISMEPTLHTGDILLVNKLNRSLANTTGHAFVPKRGQIVVFKNPFFNQGDPNAYIVKRVIGLPGDHVVVQNGRVSISTAANPTTSFNPDDNITGPQSPTSGNVDRFVPDGEFFVAGDNRLGSNSLDSRNGMSTVPIDQIEGTAILKFWPLNKLQIF